MGGKWRAKRGRRHASAPEGASPKKSSSHSPTLSVEDGRAALRRESNFSVNEKVWQARVERVLYINGFVVYHTYRSTRSNPGFPDVFAVRESDGALIVAELKVGDNKPSDAQKRWLAAFSNVTVPPLVGLWYPRHYAEVVRAAGGHDPMALKRDLYGDCPVRAPGTSVEDLEKRYSRESLWQAGVEKIMKENGLLVYHTHRSTRSEPGFPDTVAVGADGSRFVVAELKVGKNEPSEAQERWLAALRSVRSAPVVGLWYPADYAEVVRVAGGKQPF